MSFSYDAKFEVADSEVPQKLCCCRAELAGLLRTCAQISIENGYSVEFVTELPNLAKRIELLLKHLYNEKIELNIKEE